MYQLPEDTRFPLHRKFTKATKAHPLRLERIPLPLHDSWYTNREQRRDKTIELKFGIK